MIINKPELSAPSGYGGFKLITEKPKPIFLLILAVYIIIYRILTPPVNALIMDTGAEQIFLRAISNSILQIALFYPLFLIRGVGVFHPLSFPALYGLAFTIVFQPLHILFPFISSYQQFMFESTSYSVFMLGMQGSGYTDLYIKKDLIAALFLFSIQIGFLLFPSIRADGYPREVSVGQRQSIIFSACIYAIAAIAGGLVFIAMRGGIEQQILSFYKGRYETLSGLGVFTTPVKTAVVALMLWIAALPSPQVPKKFFFLTFLLLPPYWLVDGSRSSLLVVILSILIVYTLKTGSIPRKAFITCGCAAFLTFGLLGVLRQDYNATSVDFSIFSGNGLVEAIQASQTETNKRGAEEGDVAVLQAIDAVGYLSGKSYLSVISFPFPRALWPEKPKNVYVYVNWSAFQGFDINVSAPNTWGIPIEPSTEAYWNFGYSGVVIVGFIVGFLHKTIFNIFRKNPTSIPIMIVFIEALLYLNGGSRWAFYFIQNSATVLLIIILANFVLRISSSLGFRKSIIRRDHARDALLRSSVSTH